MRMVPSGQRCSRLPTTVAQRRRAGSSPSVGALDSAEGEPGPILLQGDHKAIEYRNIRITPAK